MNHARRTSQQPPEPHESGRCPAREFDDEPRLAAATTRDVGATYGAWSATYDDGNCAVEVEEVVVASLLARCTFTRVLDVATGTGRNALKLASRCDAVAGLDRSRSMLDRARQNAAQIGARVSWVEGDLRDLPFEGDRFDLVLCSLALAHVPDLEKPFLEFARVARSGAHILTTDIHPDIQALWGPGHVEHLADAPRPFPAFHGTVAEYVHAVERADLELTAAIDVPMYQTQRGFAATGILVVWARKR